MTPPLPWTQSMTDGSRWWAFYETLQGDCRPPAVGNDDRKGRPAAIGKRRKRESTGPALAGIARRTWRASMGSSRRIQDGRTPLAVSRRTPVARSMLRSDQPSRPSARTCCRFSSAKTLLMSGRNAPFLPRVNVSDRYRNGRFSGVH